MGAGKVVEDTSITWIADLWGRPPANVAVDGPHLGVMRVPFDYAVSSRPGARYGPAAVCDALRTYSAYCTDKRTSFDHASILDLGDVEPVHSFADSYRLIEEAVAAVPPDIQPVFIGGDHSITDPILRGLQRRTGARFGLIVFDAHFDSREPVPGHEHSGHWMRTVRDAFDHSHSVQLGISAPIYGSAYLADAADCGVLVMTPYDLRRKGWPAAVGEALDHAGRDMDGIYVSIDIDAIDRSYAPGTAVPNPMGLVAQDVADAVFEISQAAPVIGLDITEVSPPLDNGDVTAHVAAHLIINHWAGIARRTARAD